MHEAIRFSPSLMNIDIERNTIDGNLYHYTSGDALASILTSSTFHVSNYRFMNDPREITYIDSILEEVINENWPDDSALFGSLLKRAMAERHGAYETASEKFILSMSLNKDSLPLWQEYTKKSGYCLGLEYGKMQDWARQSGLFCLFGRVIYEKSEQTRTLYNHLSELECHILDQDHADDSKHINTIYSLIVAILDMYSVFFKDSSYSWEQEYRYCFAFPIQGFREPQVLHKVKNHIFVPYIEVNVKNDQQSALPVPLKSVRTAPLLKSESALNGLHSFLRGNNYENVDILKSEIHVSF